MHGPSGRPVARSQTSDGLALIGDGDARRLPAPALRQAVLDRVLDAAPERGGILLHPARLRKRDRDRPRRARHHAAGVVEQEHLRVRRALIDGEDVRARHAAHALARSVARRVANALRRRGRSARAGTRRSRWARTRRARRASASASGAIVDDHFRDGAAEAAVHRVLLDGDDGPRRAACDDRVAIDRPNRREVEDGRADAVRLEQRRRPRARATP